MSREFVQIESGVSDEVYQDRILPHVSRTFALTIPQLPPDLRTAVTTAYLLCRIADTIEDEPALSADRHLRVPAALHGSGERQRGSGVAGGGDSRGGSRIGRLPAEHDLVRNMERVVRVTARLHEPQRAAIQRCVEVMCYGMHHFQHTASVRGLPRSSDLDSYCYYVAGVVGEMLTELFCGYSPAISQQHAALHDLAASFAQGLQMTNILKDVWEDRQRGVCWLPQEVFTRHGIDLAQLSPERYDAAIPCRHAGTDRCGSYSPAQRPGLHVTDSRRGAWYSAFLSMGRGPRRAHTAQDRAHTAIHGRLASEGVTLTPSP